MTYHNIDNLINKYGYTPTTDFDGMKVARRRQILQVVKAARVPADWRNNPQIIGVAIVQGQRGAEYSGYIKKIDGRITVSLID